MVHRICDGCFACVNRILVKKYKPGFLYPWEKMIAIEHRHHMNYYKFVNMFTDVKHLKESAVRRSYLDILLPVPKGSKFNSNAMYLFLFIRSFIRGETHLILSLG